MTWLYATVGVCLLPSLLIAFVAALQVVRDRRIGRQLDRWLDRALAGDEARR